MATDAQGVHYREYMEDLWLHESNFEFVLQAETTALTESGVEYMLPDGTLRFLEADDIVLHVGNTPCQEDVIGFALAAEEFYIAGDCQQISDVRRSVKEAFNVAIRL